MHFSESAALRVRPEREESSQIHGAVHVCSWWWLQPGYIGKETKNHSNFKIVSFLETVASIKYDPILPKDCWIMRCTLNRFPRNCWKHQILPKDFWIMHRLHSFSLSPHSGRTPTPLGWWTPSWSAPSCCPRGARWTAVRRGSPAPSEAAPWSSQQSLRRRRWASLMHPIHTGWLVVRVPWLGWLISNVPPPCPVDQPILPNSKLPKQNQAERGMIKIIVNPTQVRDHQSHPVLIFCGPMSLIHHGSRF